MRFHWLVVGLHWLSALIVLYMLTIQHEALESTRNLLGGANNPEKIGLLRIHMALGISVLAFTVIRLIVRWRTQAPAHAKLGHWILDLASRASGWVLYGALLVMTLSGLATALLSGALPIVYGLGDGILPRNFGAFPPMNVHHFMAEVLLVLIGVHVLASLYHQYVVRDRLFQRMWFASTKKNAPKA